MDTTYAAQMVGSDPWPVTQPGPEPTTSAAISTNGTRIRATA